MTKRRRGLGVKGTIYIVQAGYGGHLKIGFTGLPLKKRLAIIQNGNPDQIYLIYSRPGTLAEEQAFHAALGQWNIRGEWFLASPQVLQAIIKDAACNRENL